MPIPNLIDWQRATTGERTRSRLATAVANAFVGRGSNMILIDIALADWLQVGTVARPEEQMAILYNLLKQCRTWLEKKQAGSATGEKTTPLYVRRKAAVQQLMAAVWARMREISADETRALQRLDALKATGGRAGAMTMTPTSFAPKALRPSYAQERQHYESTKPTDRRVQLGAVGRSISASYGHQVFDAYKGTGSTEDVRLGVKPVARMLGGKTAFEELSLAEFRQLATVMTDNAHVAYLNKVRRLRFLAVPNDTTHLLYDIHDRPLNMNAPASRRGGKPLYFAGPYAMDRYGNLFLTDKLPKYGEINYFNHSSFNAGREVLCAGMIHIGGATPGQLQYIDNSSGHYAPTEENLRNCLQVLDAQGVDLQHACVSVHGGGRYRAPTFVAAGAPDWPVDGAAPFIIQATI